VQQCRQDAVVRADLQARTIRTRDLVPAHPATLALEGHGEGAKVPQDWPEGCEPLGAEDDVVARERERKEVRGEDIVTDDAWRGAVHSRGREAFAVVELHGGTTGGVLGDEVVCRSRVEQREEGDVAEGDAHLHCLASANLGDRM